MASSGWIGRSGAMTVAPGMMSRRICAVCVLPADMKPWTYIIFFPSNIVIAKLRQIEIIAKGNGDFVFAESK